MSCVLLLLVLGCTSDPLSYPCIAPSDCGTSSVGGQEALPHEFPFYVSVQRSGSVWCSGSLVHKDWILIAAHCTIDALEMPLPVDSYAVKIGLHYANDSVANGSCVEERSVTQMIKHPGYSKTSGANDIAFLKLNASSMYPPILLYYAGLTTEDLEAENLTTNVIGHGPDGSGSISWALQKSQAPISPFNQCQVFWDPYVTSSEICLESWTGVGCPSDIGGPLFVQRGIYFIQIGLRAFSLCGDGIPSVYVRLSAFHDWICTQSSLPSSICGGALLTASPTSRTERPTGIPTKSPTQSPTQIPTSSPTTASPTTNSPSTRSPATSSPVSHSPTTRVISGKQTLNSATKLVLPLAALMLPLVS